MRAQREDIRALLIRDNLVAGMVGGAASARIYFGRAAISAPTPYVLIRLAGVSRPRTHDQRANANRRKSDQLTWEVIAVSEDGDEASDLADRIDSALDGQALGDTALLLFDDASDVSDFRQDQSGAILHQISSTFLARKYPRD